MVSCKYFWIVINGSCGKISEVVVKYFKAYLKHFVYIPQNPDLNPETINVFEFMIE